MIEFISIIDETNKLLHFDRDFLYSNIIKLWYHSFILYYKFT